MTGVDRLAGPLAATWQGNRTSLLARALAPRDATHWRIADPMLCDVWGEQLIRPAIDVIAFGPAGELVRTMQELPPHEAFLGGPP